MFSPKKIPIEQLNFFPIEKRNSQWLKVQSTNLREFIILCGINYMPIVVLPG